MLVILDSGGIHSGGVNFDAKTRRNSTDLADIFHAHIGGMDCFARALIIAYKILTESDYLKLRKKRYSSFNTGKGRQFEQGKLSLKDLREAALTAGEPRQISGRQEYFENLINDFI
jgi:xylose isomerase